MNYIEGLIVQLERAIDDGLALIEARCRIAELERLLREAEEERRRLLAAMGYEEVVHHG